MVRVISVAIACIFLTGCLTRNVDRAVYRAVAPEYRAYVEADPALTPEQKETRYRTLRLWESSVEGDK